MVAVAQAFRDAADRRLDPEEGATRLESICGPVTFSNGFLHGAETPGYGRVRPSAVL
jgi:hypothetical protein